MRLAGPAQSPLTLIELLNQRSGLRVGVLVLSSVIVVALYLVGVWRARADVWNYRLSMLSCEGASPSGAPLFFPITATAVLGIERRRPKAA